MATVTRWTSFDDASAMVNTLGWMGGGAGEATRDEYLADFIERLHPYIEAVWAALDVHGPIDGNTHQERMCPVFDDGFSLALSMRAWGDLVAAWWNSRHPDAKTNYTAFAWRLDRGEGELLELLRARAA